MCTMHRTQVWVCMDFTYLALHYYILKGSNMVTTAACPKSVQALQKMVAATTKNQKRGLDDRLAEAVHWNIKMTLVCK